MDSLAGKGKSVGLGSTHGVSINEKRYIFGASKLLQIERVSVQ